MASPVRILPQYTYNDYVQWEGRWELIDGIPYAMSPAPTPRHQIIGANLLAEFRMALKKCKVCRVSQPVDYIIDENTILQPDVLIICKNTTKKFIDFPPALVAEILSPFTAIKDRHSKFGIYEAQKIPYYLIISPDTEETEVYSLKDEAYVLQQKGKDFQFQFLFEGDCTADINFGELWT